MNTDDSERIAGLLVSAGYAETDSFDRADVIVFNTCCVRQTADDRAYGHIGALKQLKKDRPSVMIAVGGCMAQMDGEALQKTFPHVDVVFGTHNVARLPVLLKVAADEKRSAYEVPDSSADFTADLPTHRSHEWHATLPVTVGCDNYCTYCIVPYVRGREKSRELNDLVEHGRLLVADGVREITLLGQNVNSYGRDLYGHPAFTDLLDKMSAIEGLKRIRFMTAHPKDLTLETIDIVAERENLCPHFHLPLQAGSDQILERMGRRYTAEHFLSLLSDVRARMDNVSITTDIMVGFPGETLAEFEQTLAVVEEARFDQAYTFIYSSRPGTVAAKYADPVPRAVKSEWFSRLAELQKRISMEKNVALVGTEQQAFVEGPSRKDKRRLVARTPSNKLVHIDGEDALFGQTVPVRISDAHSFFLLGELVERS